MLFTCRLEDRFNDRIPIIIKCVPIHVIQDIALPIPTRGRNFRSSTSITNTHNIPVAFRSVPTEQAFFIHLRCKVNYPSYINKIYRFIRFLFSATRIILQ